jgi:hypothetical protein
VVLQHISILTKPKFHIFLTLTIGIIGIAIIYRVFLSAVQLCHYQKITFNGQVIARVNRDYRLLRP